MPDRIKTLYERRMAAGCGPWADAYGGKDHNFEVVRHHDGYFVKGAYHGRQVKDVIDLFHGVLCRIIRPDHPRLAEAERLAAQTGIEHIGKTHLHPAIVELMEKLKAEYDTLGIGPGRVLLATTGSSANNMAFRLAHAYTRGGEPFFLENAYHGADYFGNATTGAEGWHGEFSPIFPRHIDAIDTDLPVHFDPKRHLPFGDDNLKQNLTIATERFDNYKKHIKPLRPILYCEDLQGVGGSFRNAGEKYLTEMAEIVGVRDGVVVNDNVQTGMRRGSYLSVPKWLLTKPESKTPIIVTLAKAIANGAPLGAVLVPEVIVKDLEQNSKKYGLHWDTFAENARTAELASAVHDVYHEEHLGELTPVIRNVILKQLDGLQGEDGPIADIRGDGLMIGIGLKDPKKTADAIAKAPGFGIIIGKGTDALRVAPLADTPLDIAAEAGSRVARLLDSLK
ncbi:aminotransferase class III-fold pyridoxal phosphate-dependent enzyme [Candidatus Peregrinibacteria bacterium]|nr:aminotransferase class III-fold pyridoxal phosphate-dependent enzyme [Candidatus Peregrinibacteria bacterium]